MPQKFPSTAAAAGAVVMAAVLAGAYFFVSGDAPSKASPLREIPPVPAAPKTEAGTPPSTDRRQVIAAALKAGHATCLQDLDFYRDTAAAQIQRAKPPELERYVEPQLLAEVAEAAYQRLSEHSKGLQRELSALRDATLVDQVGPPLAGPSAPPPEAVSPQESEALAEARRAEIERVTETLRGSEFGGDLIKPQRIPDAQPGPLPDAVSQQDAEALARVRREETERLIEELRRSSLGGPDNDLIALEGADSGGRAAKRKDEFIVKMEAFCEDILRVARDL